MNLGKYHVPLTESQHLAALKCAHENRFPAWIAERLCVQVNC